MDETFDGAAISQADRRRHGKKYLLKRIYP